MENPINARFLKTSERKITL